MITVYFRSSSLGAWTMCPSRYFFTYVLGFKDEPHTISTPAGTLIHKALELLACKKLAQQRNETTFFDESIGKTWQTESFAPDEALQESWNYYTKTESQWDWTPAVYKDCRKSMYVVLDYNGGMFSPLKRTIVKPEQFFDYTIDQPWAKYKFKNPFGSEPEFIEGQLSVKGAMDLVCAVNDDETVLEYLDYKTGKWRRNWTTGKDKDFDDFRKDEQLRLYYYALSQAYPNAKSIIMTIFYTRAGGPFSIPFTRDDIPAIEDMIRDRFEEIKTCKIPRRIKPNFKCGWCYHDKVNYIHPDGKDSGRTVCDFLTGELKSIGIDRVTSLYGNKETFGRYKDGGGQTARETRKDD